jgi:hypothetical protein
MRPFALAAPCAAILLLFGARARAEEPDSSEKDKEQPVKVESAKSEKREPEAPAYPPPLSRWGIIGIGLATSALAYGAGAGISYAFPDAPGARDLRTPIAGPWMAIAHNGCPADDPYCSQVWVVLRSLATGIGGLAQAGGILVAIEGIIKHTQYGSEAHARRAPKGPAEPTPSTDPPKPNDKNLFWIPTPMALGSGGVGLGVVGRF